MNDCGHYETLISAWHDGELNRSGQVEMLDHLIRCAGCRDFYLDARGLAGLVAAVRAPAQGEEPSPEIWRRIERSARSRWSGWTRVPGRWGRWLPSPGWAAAAAAAALLVVFGSPLRQFRNPVDSRTGLTEIRIGDDPGGMDDERFVEVTKRVLGADRKYRRAFYEIMKQVVEDTQGNEPSMDVLLGQRERRNGAELPESVHGPS